jgi:DNA-binding CsgD family transcriptional regulator
MLSLKEGGLVEALYDAALGRQSWDDCGRQLVDTLGGKTLILSTHDSRHTTADVVVTLGMNAQVTQEYAQFARHDVWALGALERGAIGKAVTSPDVVEDRVLLQSYIYNEYMRRSRVDIRYLAGAMLPLHGGRHAAVGIHRPHDANDFTPGEIGLLGRILPHLQRALEVRQRLQPVERPVAAAWHVLDRLNFGVILMNAAGRLLHANAAGEAILRAGDGLMRTPDGLRACNKDDDRRLQQLVGRLRHGLGTIHSSGGHVSIRRRSGRQAYAVMLAPVPAGLVGTDRTAPAFMMFVSDPGAKIVSDLAALADLFGFPPAEARLVLALLSGTPLPKFAQQAGISYNTARTQLARAMARTESRSQLDLVLLVARALGGVSPVVGNDRSGFQSGSDRP